MPADFVSVSDASPTEPHDRHEPLLREFPALRAYATRLARPCYSVDDLVQDTYLQALQAIQGRPLPRTPQAFLKCLAKRTAWRRVREEERHAAAHGHDTACAQASHGDAPADTLVRKEATSKLRRALSTLSARNRGLLRAYYWQDLPCGDIADALGTTRDSVKTALNRSRCRLRRLIA